MQTPEQTTPEHVPGDAVIGVAVTISICLAFAVLVVSLPLLPLADLPNHLVTLAKLGQALPPGSLDYLEVVWSPRPNMAMELTYVAFAGNLPPETFAKAFLLGGVFLFVLGAAGRSLVLYSRITPLLPIVAGTFLSMPLHLGFMNYVFAAALLPGVLALYIMIRKRTVIGAVLFGNCAGTVLLVGHGFSFGTFGLLLAGTEIGLVLERAKGRTGLLRGLVMAGLVTAAASLVPLILIADYFLTNPSASTNIRWPSLRDKLAEIRYLSAPYSSLLPLVSIGFLASILIGTVSAGKVPLKPLLMGGVVLLLLAALAMPGIIGGFAYANTRLWSVFVAFAALALIPPKDHRGNILIWVIAIGLLVWEFGTTARTWNTSAQQIAEIRNVLLDIDTGASLVAIDPDQRQGLFSQRPTLHVAAYAALDRGAFLPTLFALPEQHLIRYNSTASALSQQLHPKQFRADHTTWLTAASTQTDAVVLLEPEGPASQKISAALMTVGFTRIKDVPGARIMMHESRP